MARATIGDTVYYRLPTASPNAGVTRVAIIAGIPGGLSGTAGQDTTVVHLFVLGIPADGGAFTSGPAFVASVSRDQSNTVNGTWRGR